MTDSTITFEGKTFENTHLHERWLDDKGRWHCSECGCFVKRITDDHRCLDER